MWLRRNLQFSDPFNLWNTDEKKKLLLCVANFQIQFPLYSAYKYNIHPSSVNILTQESNIFEVFCGMNDIEAPLHYFLMYVCFVRKMASYEGFEYGSPETLPFFIAHACNTIVSIIRIWLYIPAFVQYIIPFRTYVIRYFSKFSDQNLRQGVACNWLT